LKSIADLYLIDIIKKLVSALKDVNRAKHLTFD